MQSDVISPLDFWAKGLKTFRHKEVILLLLLLFHHRSIENIYNLLKNHDLLINHDLLKQPVFIATTVQRK